MATQFTVAELARKLRERVPESTDISDTDLVLRVTAAAPEVRKLVNMKELLAQSKGLMKEADVRQKRPVISQLETQAQQRGLFGTEIEAAKGFGSLLAGVPKMAYGLMKPEFGPETPPAERGVGPMAAGPRLVGGIARQVGNVIWPQVPGTPVSERIGEGIFGQETVEKLKTDPIGGLARIVGMGAGMAALGGIGSIPKAFRRIPERELSAQRMGAVLTSGRAGTGARVVTGVGRPSEAVKVKFPYFDDAISEIGHEARQVGMKLSDENLPGIIVFGRAAQQRMIQIWEQATGLFKTSPAIQYASEHLNHVVDAMSRQTSRIASERAVLEQLAVKLQNGAKLSLDESRLAETLMSEELRSTFGRGPHAMGTETISIRKQNLLKARQALADGVSTYADSLTTNPVASRALRTYGSIKEAVQRAEGVFEKLGISEALPSRIDFPELYHGARAVGAGITGSAITAATHGAMAVGRKVLGTMPKALRKHVAKSLRAFDEETTRFGPMGQYNVPGGAGLGLPPGPTGALLPGPPPQLPPRTPPGGGGVPPGMPSAAAPMGGAPLGAPQAAPVAPQTPSAAPAQPPPGGGATPQTVVAPSATPTTQVAPTTAAPALAQQRGQFPKLREALEVLSPEERTAHLERLKGATKRQLLRAEAFLSKTKTKTPSKPPTIDMPPAEEQAANLKWFDDMAQQLYKKSWAGLTKVTERTSVIRALSEAIPPPPVSRGGHRQRPSDAPRTSVKPRTGAGKIKARENEAARRALGVVPKNISLSQMSEQAVSVEAAKAPSVPLPGQMLNPEELQIQAESIKKLKDIKRRVESGELSQEEAAKLLGIKLRK